MASRVAIAIRREQAVYKLTGALKTLFGEDFILPTQGRDPDLLHAVQLEAIADYLERYAGAKEAKAKTAPARAGKKKKA